MMKRVFYEFLRFYVRLGLYFYFHKIEIRNLENIPGNNPVLFTANHQNAFLDALLVVAFNRRNTHFLTRAGIFGNPLVNWILSLLQMMPIYRIRDGKLKLSKNQEIFEKCYRILEEGHTLLIFPEGNHDIRRRLRPLSKGFTRIAFGALENTSLQHLTIVPIGLNYQHHQKFRSSVSVIFGKPIQVSEFEKARPGILREAVASEMKTLITHIGEEDYEEKVKFLSEIGADFLKPEKLNPLLKSGAATGHAKKKKLPFFQRILNYLAAFNNLLVILIWRLIKPVIKDPVFIGSIKFAYGIFIVPLIYLLQARVVFQFTGITEAVIYFIASVLLVLLVKRSD